MDELQMLLTRLRPARERQVKEQIITELQLLWRKLYELKVPRLKVLCPLLALIVLAAGLLLPWLQLDVLLLGVLLLATWPWVWPHLQKRVLAALTTTQERQQVEIDRLVTFHLQQCLQESEFHFLHALAAGEACLVMPPQVTDRFMADLRRLYTLGLIERVAGHGFRTLLEAVQGPAGQADGVDVKAHFFLTDQGRKYLALLHSELVAFLSDS